MLRFAGGKTKELFGGIWGDALITILAFVAAFLVSRTKFLDDLGVHVDENIAVLSYFIIFLAIVLTVYWLFNLAASYFFGTRPPLELTLSTLPGRPEQGFGRYLTMYIDNKSLWDIDSSFVRLRDMSVVGAGTWRPPADAIKRMDKFLWGTDMVKFSGMERAGNKGIKAQNHRDTIVDLLHTEAKSEGKLIYLEQQYLGDTIDAPVGKYLIDLEILINHMGRDSVIPLGLVVEFLGGMELGAIEPVVDSIDGRIKRINLSRDHALSTLWCR